MFAALGAIAAGISAASAVGGTVIGSANASKTNALNNQIAGNNAQSAQNSEQYQRALNAEAMRRAVAGSTSGRGDQLTYDPATNSWVTKLSGTGAQVQNATDRASIGRNTTDVADAQRVNSAAIAQAARARGLSDVAGNDLKYFNPTTTQGLEGALQDTSTIANRQAEDPIIADTLRSFARTGTAAGPVLTQMMRDNATSLRSTMGENKIKALTQTAGINNTKREGLLDNYGKLTNLTTPALNYPQLSTLSPNDAIAQEATTRASGAAQPASTAAYSNSASTNANSNANKQLLDNSRSNNGGAEIAGIGKQVQDVFNPNNNFLKWMKGQFAGGGSGNAGDVPQGTTFGGNYPGATTGTNDF